MRSSVSAGERLTVRICYLVICDSMQTISLSYRLGHSTVCKIISSTCAAIWEALFLEYLCTPKSSDGWKRISEGFENIWNFPHCIGAIDRKHIVMQGPFNSLTTKAHIALFSWLC